jgi:TonB family protein
MSTQKSLAGSLEQRMNSRAKMALLLAFCASVAVHGAAYASLSADRRRAPALRQNSEMSFELPPLPTAAVEPEPTSQPPEPALPRNSVAAHAPPVSRHAPAAAEPAPSVKAEASALDLSGITLSNDTGVGFAMPAGDGSARGGPIGLGTSGIQTTAAAASAKAAPKSPALVSASDLSEHPRPPSLTGLLRANYPEEARQRGLRGSASLRARIDADGVIRAARGLSESSAGFGAACRRTVLGSRWSPPRDKNGAAVATEIVYTCHFEVDQ